MTDSIMTTYGRLPVTFTKGDGAWLWDDKGERYLDALAGIAVCSLGHANPEIRDALADQAGTLIHTSNLYHIDLQQQLADKLTQLSGLSNAFFCNSGAEANEAAIKLARLHGHNNSVGTPTIIVMENSFHGRTLATLTATGNPAIRKGFGPLPDGFVRAPYDDLAAIEELAETHSNIVAILVEPIQGEGGIHIPADDYLPGLRKICDQNNWLLMLDEIQTGMGRTGEMFAFQHSDIVPDVMTLAKALGNGMPIGACLAASTVANTLQPGTHGSTYGGNPLACRAALTVLSIFERDAIVNQAVQHGELLLNGLRKQLASISGIIEVRGKGMMIGIELDRPCTELVKLALDQNLLINVTAQNVVRLLPPLIMNKAELGQLTQSLSALITEFLASSELAKAGNLD